MTDDNHWENADVVQTSIFLWQGLMDVACPGGNYQKLSDTSIYDSHFEVLGQDGGALSIGYIASVLEEELKRWKDQELPGVYLYEIIEPLGNWLAEEGPRLYEFQFGAERRDPATALVKEKYHELMAAWFVTEALTS